MNREMLQSQQFGQDENDDKDEAPKLSEIQAHVTYFGR